MRGRGGLSLIEVLAAVTLLAVLATATLPLTRAMHAAGEAPERVRALETMAALTPTELRAARRGEVLRRDGLRIAVVALDGAPSEAVDRAVPLNRVQWLRCRARSRDGSRVLGELYRLVAQEDPATAGTPEAAVP